MSPEVQTILNPHPLIHWEEFFESFHSAFAKYNIPEDAIESFSRILYHCVYSSRLPEVKWNPPIQKILKIIIETDVTSKLLIYVWQTFRPIFKKTILQFCSLFSELDSPEREKGEKQIISLVEQFRDSPEKQQTLQEIHNMFIPGNAQETCFEISWSTARVMSQLELPPMVQSIVGNNTTTCPKSTVPSANARSTADIILTPGTVRDNFITIILQWNIYDVSQLTYNVLNSFIEQPLVMALFRVSDEEGNIPEFDEYTRCILRRKLVDHKSTSTASFRNPTTETYRDFLSNIETSFGPFNQDTRKEIEYQLREKFAKLVWPWLE